MDSRSLVSSSDASRARPLASWAKRSRQTSTGRPSPVENTTAWPPSIKRGTRSLFRPISSTRALPPLIGDLCLSPPGRELSVNPCSRPIGPLRYHSLMGVPAASERWYSSLFPATLSTPPQTGFRSPSYPYRVSRRPRDQSSIAPESAAIRTSLVENVARNPWTGFLA